jgi:hypothetical protein
VVLTALGLLPTLASPEARAESASRFAVVVGANDPGRADLPALSYADDDAVRNAELLRAQGAEVRLFGDLDAETRRLYPWAVPLAERPTRARVLAAIREQFARIAEAKRRGDKVDFFFLYSGHGALADSGEGALVLADGLLTRTDLYQQVLARSPADFNHLLVDACHAYQFVSSRGEAADLERSLTERARRYLDSQTPERFPNTGVIVATSASAKTHEWSEYHAGVFSHEVRSALLGAADVDGDGQVTYREAGAFIAAANDRVAHAKARLDVYVQPPRRDPARPLVTWTDATRLVIERSVAGHLWLEDERGVRLTETHKSSEQPLTVALLPRERYYLTLEAQEYSFTAAAGQAVRLETLARSTGPGLRARGSIDEAFRRGLFAVPFGQATLAAYRFPRPEESAVTASARPERPAARPLRTVGYGLVIGAAVAGLASGGFYLASNDAYRRYQGAETPAERDRWQRRTRSFDWATTISVTAALASAGGGVTLLLYDRFHSRPVTLAVGPGTLQALVEF